MSCYNKTVPRLRTLNQDFFRIWSDQMAYVLGFFAADGSMLQNSRGSCFIEFSVTDKEVLDFIRSAAGSSHAISTRPLRSEKWKQQYRLQIGSKAWFKDLLKLGFTQGKSKSLRFPNVPKQYLPDFIRGYFDGDGCVHFKEYWSKERQKNIWVFSTIFTSGSQMFLEDLHKSIRTYGVKGGAIAIKERGFALVLSRKDSLALYRLMYHTGQTTGFYLTRKFNLFGKAIKTLYGESFLENTQR